MGIAITLQQYLNKNDVDYDVIAHEKTGCSASTAEVSHVPGDCLAKGVIIKRKKGYLLAIVPASRQVELSKLSRYLKQAVCLATEEEIGTLFHDCDAGAIPPIGGAYGLRSVVDERLEGQQDIYFEGGDHRTLIRVSGDQFHKLMEKVPHEKLSTKDTAVMPLGGSFEDGYWGA